MQKPPSTAPKGGLGVHDLLFVLSKHKWKITFLSFAGFGAAAAVYIRQEPIYKSEAKLLVRYVMEKGTVDPYEAMKSPGGGGRAGDPVINTEIEIIKSVDLALDVAESVGVDRLIPGSDPIAARSSAAKSILAKLDVTTGRSNTVLYVNYSDKDQQLAKDVLTHLVDRYFKKHLEIHRSAAAFDVVANQLEEARDHLQQTEAKLNQLRTETGVMSLDDATGALSSQRTKTQEDLLQARGQHAELLATLGELDKDSADVHSASTVLSDKTPHAAEPTPPKQKPLEFAAPPSQKISEYRAIMDLLGFLQKRELELQIKFKPGNRLLALNQQQIDHGDAKRRALERDYPGLFAEAAKISSDPQNPRAKLIMEKAGLAAIEAKINVLNAHLKEIGEQFGREYTIGAKIEALRRQRDIEDSEYRVLETNLKNARIDQTLDPSRMPNITIVQRPSEPVQTFDTKTKKIVLGLAGSGLGIGIALACLIELVFNRKVSRPIEIQTRLQLPLLLSIPYIRKKGQSGLLLAHEKGVPCIGLPEDRLTPRNLSVANEGRIPPKRPNHFITPYSETIRDRILFNFEVNNITHKPKLVAVTALSAGAGASTIAAGLARSFAEVRSAKVLLVDLSASQPEESPLFGEIPRHSLSGALHLAESPQFRSNPQNLYYASANARRDDGGLTTFSPMHLYDLMPHLQASDYDYIVFDMPPVDQTSRTLTMAGMMDKVLLILDAENTSRDGLIWGYAELVKGKADVSCVFNKNRTPSPGWLVGKG